MDGADQVVKQWAENFNKGEAAAIAALYTPDATIWGTLGQYIATQPAEIRSYFDDAARAGLEVKLGACVIHPAGEASVIIAGHYDFSRMADGETAIFPARYTFVLVKRNDVWLIAHQHSSLMPIRSGPSASE